MEDVQMKDIHFESYADGVEIVPGHQSACFAGERKEKRGLK